MAGGHEANNSTDWAIQARYRLARRRAEKPATKAGQIRALWPDIEAGLGLGQSLKTICTWLAEDAGITLGVTSLTSYISRIRRREAYLCSPARALEHYIKSVPESVRGAVESLDQLLKKKPAGSESPAN